jgi:hypothetical protein
VAGGYPIPDRHDEEIWVGVNPPVRLRSKNLEGYLVYYINKSLSIFSTEISGLLDLITVGEEICNQTDALIHGEGMADQLFPAWRV